MNAIHVRSDLIFANAFQITKLKDLQYVVVVETRVRNWPAIFLRVGHFIV